MAGLDGYDVIIAREGVTPGTYVTVGGVLDITPAEASRDAYDVTDRDSGGFAEFIGAAIQDNGEVTFDIHYDPAVHEAVLRADMVTADPHNWRLTWPNAETETFGAVLTNISREAPHDDKVTGSITLKVSGEVTYA